MNDTSNTDAGASIFSGAAGSDDSNKPDELTLLKQRAAQLGVEFSNNIGLNTLRERINARLGEIGTSDGDVQGDEGEGEDEAVNGGESQDAEDRPVPEPAPVAAPVAAESQPQRNPLAETSPVAESKPAKKKTLRQQIQAEQLRLVRIRITNMDPKKGDLPGEVITVANEFLGTIRKFVPFGEATDGGYHVPYCIYNVLKKRQFLHIRTRKGPNNTPIVEQNMVREFAIEVLPDLTPAELAKLAATQAASGSLNGA
jgi:hypothetical protein